jgi:PhoH-like ATPase
MRKTFVLDTNVILHEPRAALRFGDNDVVLPIYVVEELDQFKKDLSELGRNAREFSRLLDDLRAQGSIAKGVPLESGGTLRIAFIEAKRPRDSAFTARHQYDNMILTCALELKDRINGTGPVILVTKDANLRIRADALGLIAEDYDATRIEISELYPGHREITVTAEQFAVAGEGTLTFPDLKLCANEYVMLRNEARAGQFVLARHDSETGRLRTLPKRREAIWGITPRNKEQSFALDLLLDDDVKLVTLVGKAGTGKTLLALAAALFKVTEEQAYQRVLVSRPIFPLGRDIGYLPGTVEEKLDPWMKPIYDNVELLLGLTQSDRKDGRSHDELIELGLIEIEPLTYIRGRSIPNQFIIVDEAQNLTPHEVKTILTRAGEGTKIVFTGDPYQIDNPYVDSANNGLVHIVHRFREQRIAGTVTLSKGERSQLAEMAANLL